MINCKKPVRILKVKGNQPRKELDFELDYQLSLTVQERFRMMEQSSRQILEQLLRNGYRKPFEVIKRS